MDTKSLFDELQKLGAVDPEEARRALDKLDTLEKTKADPAQVARYSALGAVAGPIAGAVGDIISGTKPFGMGAGGGVKGVLRNIAAQSAKGAIGLGAVPLVRHALDRKAEMGTLQQYMQENAPEPDNGISHKTAFIGVGIDVASFSEDKEHKGVINIGFPHVVSAQLRHKPTGMGAGIGMAGPLISWSPATMSEYRREHEKAKKKTAEAWSKIAFGPEGMQKVLQRVKGMQLPISEAMGIGSPYAALPSKAGVMPRVREQINQQAHVLGEYAPSDFKEQAMANIAPGVASISGYLGKAPMVAVPKRGDAARALVGMTGKRTNLSGSNRKALDALAKGHELAEHQVKPSFGTAGFGHRSPDVILREHNMITSLPPEYAPAGNVVKSLRAGGEAPVMQAATGVTLGEGPRFSRHARKHLTKMWSDYATDATRQHLQANPTLLQQMGKTADAWSKIAFGPEAMQKVLQKVKGMSLPMGDRFGGYSATLTPKGGARDIRYFTNQRAKASAQPLPVAAKDNIINSEIHRERRLFGNLNKAPFISVPPRGDAATFLGQSGLVGKDRKALEAVVKGHELAEHQVSPNVGVKDFGHRSPDVILREHNMVSTLPPEHNAVKGVLQQIRVGKEAPAMQKATGLTYGESPRVSRHARKHLTKMWGDTELERQKEDNKVRYARMLENINKSAGVGVGAPMTVSEYSGPMGYGAFPLVSHQGSKPPNSLRAPVTKLGQFELTGYGDPGEGPRPNRLVSHQGGSPVPGLRGVLEKKGSIRFPSGSTPAGRLASGQRIGLPKVTAPSGPSIAEVSKPQGFGTSMPGAHKIGI